MDRGHAMELLKERIKTRNLIKHMLAAEACMRKAAEELGGDPEVWGLAGLLHDIDYEETSDRPQEHGLVSAEILAELGAESDIIGAVKAHAGKKERETSMEKALYAVDPLTGLIVAAALMHPEKRLEAVDTEFLMNRFREKRFAAGADRDQISSCSELGIDTQEFAGLCLEAMKEISGELGL